jgi:hypothetical protein
VAPIRRGKKSKKEIRCCTRCAFDHLPHPQFRSTTSASPEHNANRAEGNEGADGDGGGAAGGCRGRDSDVPVGAVRLHAGGLDGGGDVLPEAAGRPVRAPGHRLPPLRPALRLQHPLRPPRRRQLQPHRRRCLLRSRSHQPLPLRRRAPVPGAGGLHLNLDSVQFQGFRNIFFRA